MESAEGEVSVRRWQGAQDAWGVCARPQLSTEANARQVSDYADQPRYNQEPQPRPKCPRLAPQAAHQGANGRPETQYGEEGKSEPENYFHSLSAAAKFLGWAEVM